MTAATPATLACPLCRDALESSENRLDCPACGRRYAIEEGIAVLRAEDGIDAAQLAYFDEEVDDEFEVERPFGLPRFHAWLLREKVRRAVAPLRLRGARVLVVCGGSGMDAEFLEELGGDVATTDLSVGACLRACERARRHARTYTAVSADATRLPFADDSFDVAYVHDGLHHLPDPLAALREMARVARAVCLTEPAQATATALAVRLGLAVDREEAGNRVARLRLEDVRATLEREGFRIVRAERYAMLYRHEPGRPMRLLSLPGVFPLARLAFRLVNLVLARVGNKLVVTAVRT